MQVDDMGESHGPNTNLTHDNDNSANSGIMQDTPRKPQCDYSSLQIKCTSTYNLLKGIDHGFYKIPFQDRLSNLENNMPKDIYDSFTGTDDQSDHILVHRFAQNVCRAESYRGSVRKTRTMEDLPKLCRVVVNSQMGKQGYSDYDRYRTTFREDSQEGERLVAAFTLDAVTKAYNLEIPQVKAHVPPDICWQKNMRSAN